MVRVCTQGEGRVLVADVAMPPEKREAFNRVEKLRDPSHVRNLTPVEFLQMASTLNLRDLKPGSSRRNGTWKSIFRPPSLIPGIKKRSERSFEKISAKTTWGWGRIGGIRDLFCLPHHGAGGPQGRGLRTASSVATDTQIKALLKIRPVRSFLVRLRGGIAAD